MSETFNYYDPNTGKIEIGGFNGSAPSGGGGFNQMLGPISRGLGFASGVFDALKSFQAARMYKGQAKQYKLQAAQAKEAGFQTGMDIQREGNQVLGEMTVAFGKSGSLLEGSPLLVIADTTQEIQRGIGRAIEQGRIEEQAYLHMAKQAKQAGKAAKLAGIGKLTQTLTGFNMTQPFGG